MKQKILELREEGKSYNEIQSILGCSKGTISYHCGKGQKEKSLVRQRKNRKTIKGILYKKLDKFLRSKVHNFKRGSRGRLTQSKLSYKTAYKRILENPVCYITGATINLEDPKSYELDHIIPVSKGGPNTLSNLGLSLKEANRAKDDLYLNEFIELCKRVCENNGYMVVVAESAAVS